MRAQTCNPAADRQNQQAIMARLFSSNGRQPRSGAPARQRPGWILGCVLTALLSAPALAANFTASLDRNTALVGEPVGLTLSFDGVTLSSSPRMPDIPGLQVLPGMSSGVNSSTGPDGKTTVVQTFKFTLMAAQPGEFTIPAFEVQLNGQRLSSLPLKLTVLREDPSAPPAELANQAAFLWPVWPKREAFVNEIVTLELRLYVHGSVSRIGDFQFPPLAADGVSAGTLAQSERYQRRVGNVTFNVYPLQVALTPLRVGTLSIGPLEGSLVLNPRDPFDWAFRRGQPQQVRLALERQELRVLPLPANNVPASFNGAVGRFEMSVSVGPTNVAVGDPITVKVQLTGRGALELLTLPEQPAWKEFTTYPATTRVESTDALGVQGTKFFEQIVAPQSADIQELPALEFSFFDPDRREYRTLRQPSAKLVVRPTATATPVIAAAKVGEADAPPPAQDIVGIKQRPGPVAMVQSPLALRPWFWGIQSVPVLAWLAAIVWRRRREALANNPRLRRRRQVAQIVNDGLEELRRLAAQNDSDSFFATLFRLLQEQIGDRLDMPASSITEAVVDERLKPAGLPDAACGALHELFQTCNLARYAPVRSSQELAALIPRLEAVILQLRRFKA
jgi:hypothetical protein